MDTIDPQHHTAHFNTPSEQTTQDTYGAALELQQAGRLAMYEELTTALAHEINNPVYAARLALELLEQDLGTLASVGSDAIYLTIATDGLRQVSAIIERLRLAIQNETLLPPTTSLDSLIAEVRRAHTWM